jgi:hypothetical protein
MTTENVKKISYKEHPFFMKMGTLVATEITKNGYPQASEKFDYLNKVQAQYYRVKHTLDTLILMRVFIAEAHPSSNVNKDSTIKTRDYLRYHIENFFLRITTYKDQIFQLLNDTYEMEIKRGASFERTLIKKAEQQNLPEVLLIIRNTNLLFENTNIINIRNNLAHNGDFRNSDLGMLDGSELLTDTNPDDNDLLSAMGEIILGKIVKENIDEMTKIEEQMATHFFSVLDVLLPMLDRRVESKVGLS